MSAFLLFCGIFLSESALPVFSLAFPFLHIFACRDAPDQAVISNSLNFYITLFPNIAQGIDKCVLLKYYCIKSIILDSDRPIYAQIVDRLKHEIVSGFYPPGSRLPSVRDLAAQASVNPNTMQKAFTELERTGLIVTRRTSGRTVTEDTALIEQVRSELAELQISQFLTRMQHLGYQKDDSIRLLLAKKEENS